jgi:segregation and condensation protein B
MDDELPTADDEDSFDAESDDFEADDCELSSEELEDWGGSELEEAYLKALSALEASDSEMANSSDEDVEETTEELTEDHAQDAIEVGDEDQSLSSFEQRAASSRLASSRLSEATAAAPRSNTAEDLAELMPPPAAPTATSSLASVPAAVLPPTPRQIIEACLFVGGPPLTAKRLATVLKGEFQADFVDQAIDQLNHLYAAENRPYEIQMVEGGYRLTLREEFERIRHKVYGMGPKEVRLSQEALEVLAVVAYYQPITQAKVEELGKPGCGPVLRQLVRRELLAIERDPKASKEVNYKTTARFLSLFAISSLDELPRPEQVSYK